MEQIPGGVCAPKGFTASAIHCGLRRNPTKKDLTLIYSACPAHAAAVYTQNLVKGAPLVVTRENLANGVARAVICNSGNANACTKDGIQVARRMCELTGKVLGLAPEDVVVASTGVIGKPMDITPIERSLDSLAAGRGPHGDAAAEGILTTDTYKKEIAVAFTAGQKRCILGGIAKGSGMIHPDMATALVFLTTDCAISAAMLQKALATDVRETFNMLSIDGETSTNDMAVILANGLAGNAEITQDGADFAAFMQALNTVTVFMCQQIAGDGEGATKLLECDVSGAPDEAAAKTAAKSVICSSLVKTAMFGADANWGRVLCALGHCGAPIDPMGVDVSFSSPAGEVTVCQNGVSVPFSEEKAKRVLQEHDIRIRVGLHLGAASATAWGCDLTYDYVKINGDYRAR